MQTPLFSGTCTALITPFQGGTVNLAMLCQLLQRQIQHKIPAVVLCGTTGEVSTLTEEERREIIHCGLHTAQGKMKIIAGCGSNDTAEAVKKAKTISALGVDALLVVTPYYNKASKDGLEEHYLKIADASNVPIILYNVPSRTGVDIPLSVYEKLSQHENIAGVKEACGNITKIAEIIDTCGDALPVWSGNDDQIVPIMSLGGAGVISVLSNICPCETKAMTDACMSNDFLSAGKLQVKYMKLINALFSDVNPIAIKEAMGMIGFAVGSPRLPLTRLCQDKYENLRKTLLAYHLIT